MVQRTIWGAALLEILCHGLPTIVEVHLFQAVNRDGIDAHVANQNLRDLIGVLQYVHTEVVPERDGENLERRNGGIDTFAAWYFKVKNPPELVDPESGFSRFQDFGPFVPFERGQSVNESADLVFTKYGDFVGAQQYADARFRVDLQHYEFSVSGFCPNLPWECTDGYPGCPAHDPPISTARCSPPNDPCPAKGSPNRPSTDCLGNPADNVLEGGLCPNGKEPTGSLGCAYSHGDVSTVSIDDITGISQEDCGGRPCEDWLDFRKNCATKEYKQRFNPKSWRIERTSHCVEYDIHPQCKDNCSASGCLRLPHGQRELGLPFWRGRCDARENRIRAETLAQAFGVPGAIFDHRFFRFSENSFDVTCRKPEGTLCTPAPGTGAPYCSRLWSGVCEQCYIPGTSASDINIMTVCPYEVLERLDYQSLVEPECRSRKASDLCCLYTRDCLGKSDPKLASLDDDGYFLVSSLQDTESMSTFLFRVAEEKMDLEIMDRDAIREIAYWLWDLVPLRGMSMEKVQALLAPHLGPRGRAHDQRGHSSLAFVVAFLLLAMLSAFVAVRWLSQRHSHQVTPPRSDDMELMRWSSDDNSRQKNGD